MSRELCFLIPGGGGTLVMESEVLAVLSQNRQRRLWHAEACGQLFARFDGTKVILAQATGPRPGDRRGRYFCHPDRLVEQNEINEMFAQGLHYVGDWHTHPELVPTPSGKDEQNMRDILAGARLEVLGLFLVIVGTGDFPEGLWAGLCCPGKGPERLGLAPESPRLR